MTCRAEAWPPAQISWRAPPGALNIGLSSNNSTLSVASAMGSHGGEYECAATNAHGRHARRITVRVAGEWQLADGVSDLQEAWPAPSDFLTRALPPYQSPPDKTEINQVEDRGPRAGGDLTAG